jgi:hypothetical protein
MFRCEHYAVRQLRRVYVLAASHLLSAVSYCERGGGGLQNATAATEYNPTPSHILGTFLISSTPPAPPSRLTP